MKRRIWYRPHPLPVALASDSRRTRSALRPDTLSPAARSSPLSCTTVFLLAAGWFKV